MPSALFSCSHPLISVHALYSHANFRMIVMAGDISPMDILTHIPLLAEESSNPYVFVPSKETLGQASATKRPTSCVMLCPAGTMVRKKPKVPRKDKDGNLVPVKEDDPEKEKEKEKDREEYREAYEEVVKEVQALVRLARSLSELADSDVGLLFFRTNV